MTSVIIASYKEEKSVPKAIEAVYRSLKNAEIDNFELIQVSPDQPTLEAGLKVSKELNIGKFFHQITDPRKGKSFALNLALDKAKGDIIVMTDGDVEIGENAIKELLKPINSGSSTASTGQPTPVNDKGNFMGYLAHLLTAAADDKRKTVFNEERDGFFIKKGGYFPLSGYLLAYKNLVFIYDPHYIDDTFITLLIVDNGHQLAYSPRAEVFVKFPTTLKDYLIQRRRNIHGTKDLHKDDRFEEIEDQRSFSKEVGYILFPIKYANSAKEFIFSLGMYPLRIITWIYAMFPEKGRGYKTWKEIESTKS